MFAILLVVYASILLTTVSALDCENLCVNPRRPRPPSPGVCGRSVLTEGHFYYKYQPNLCALRKYNCRNPNNAYPEIERNIDVNCPGRKTFGLYHDQEWIPESCSRWKKCARQPTAPICARRGNPAGSPQYKEFRNNCERLKNNCVNPKHKYLTVEPNLRNCRRGNNSG